MLIVFTVPIFWREIFFNICNCSEKAVICLRDGQFCLLCRVGDMRNTHLVEAHVRLQFITDRETAEGEVKLPLNNEGF